MINYIIHNVQTQDNKTVCVYIQCKSIDGVLIQNIKDYIQSNMSVNSATIQPSLNYRKAIITDENNNSRDFISCFMLTWDSKYSKVINADLISFVEF